MTPTTAGDRICITMEIELDYFEDYFRIAIDAYKDIVRFEKELDDLYPNASKSDIVPVDIMVKGFEQYYKIDRLALIVVIFCGTSLEAYINYYGIRKLSKNYFSTYLDKLDLFSKWVVIPRIITGTQLDVGSKPLQDLAWLIALRNKLVHYKSRKIEVADIKNNIVLSNDASRAIETVRNLARELKKIDDDIHIYWTTEPF